jgi:hypothetical protein
VSCKRAVFAIVASLALLTPTGAPGATDPDDRFLDQRAEWRPFRPSYRAWFSPHRREPQYLRAAAEGVLLVGLGTAYYWVDPTANRPDWDYPTFGEKLRFEAVRFDDNKHTTNHVLHPLAGAAVYGFSRVNGLQPWEAFGYAALSSIVWEYGLEFREQASINDMVFTPFGGMAVGEFFLQLGDYLNSAPGGGSLGNRIAAATLGLPRNMHDALDRPPEPIELPADSLGFSSAYWHHFLLGYELSRLGNDAGRGATLHGTRIEAKIAAMPGFLRPGSFTQEFSSGNFVEMRWKMGFADSGLADADLWFHSTLAGVYDQNFRASGSGGLSGQATLVGLSSALRFSDRRLMGRFDRFAIAHLLGPRLGWWLGAGKLLTHVDWSMHADFAGIHPMALWQWRREHPDAGVRSVLSRQGYGFAYGLSSRLSSELELAGLSVGTNLGYGRYYSIQGLDRHQADVTHDVLARDEIIELGAKLGYAPASAPVSIEVSIGELRRAGIMADQRMSAYDRRLSLGLGLLL